LASRVKDSSIKWCTKAAEASETKAKRIPTNMTADLYLALFLFLS
jgi:hypothetical protein